MTNTVYEPDYRLKPFDFTNDPQTLVGRLAMLSMPPALCAIVEVAEIERATPTRDMRISMVCRATVPRLNVLDYEVGQRIRHDWPTPEHKSVDRWLFPLRSTEIVAAVDEVRSYGGGDCARLRFHAPPDVVVLPPAPRKYRVPSKTKK